MFGIVVGKPATLPTETTVRPRVGTTKAKQIKSPLQTGGVQSGQLKVLPFNAISGLTIAAKLDPESTVSQARLQATKSTKRIGDELSKRSSA